MREGWTTPTGLRAIPFVLSGWQVELFPASDFSPFLKASLAQVTILAGAGCVLRRTYQEAVAARWREGYAARAQGCLSHTVRCARHTKV